MEEEGEVDDVKEGLAPLPSILFPFLENDLNGSLAVAVTRIFAVGADVVAKRGEM